MMLFKPFKQKNRLLVIGLGENGFFHNGP